MATRRIKPRTPDPKRGQSSEEYWREREARQRAENIRNEAKTAEKINRIFATVQDDIQQEIDSFYHRYAKDEGIDLIEARRRVSQLDIKKYERLAQQYVKAAHEGAADVAFSEEANEQMRLYNTTMRINRLEMLKARCGIRAMSGYSEAQQLINDELEERAYSEYARLSGILGNTVQFNENLVRSIVNASYQNATWSERLWNNQSLLSEQIGAQLAQGILTGKGSRVLAANIQKLTGQSAYNCLRLMRTELRRVQTAAAEQSMRDNGVRQYKFMVENAINPCEECLNLDGHVYDLDEMAIGKNAPPIHPNCVLPDTKITAPGMEAVMRSEYSGDVIELRTAHGARLAVTPNHIVLTARGWVRAKELVKGDKVVNYSHRGEPLVESDPTDHDRVPTIEKLFASLVKARGVAALSVPATAEHLKGDVIPQSKIEVVLINSALGRELDSAATELLGNVLLVGALEVREGKLFSNCAFHEFLMRAGFAADGIMGRLRERGVLLRGSVSCADLVRLRTPADYDTRLLKVLANDAPADTVLFSKDELAGADGVVRNNGPHDVIGKNDRGVMRDAEFDSVLTQNPLNGVGLPVNEICCLTESFAGIVEFDDVVDLSVSHFSGHVYDTSSMSTLYIANGIVTSNCHCATAPYVDEDKWQRWLDGPAQDGVPWDEFESEPEAPEESAGSGQESADTSGIEYDPRVSDEQKNILRSLVDEYRTRLQNVTIGARKAAGDVDVSGARMRLSDKHAGTAFHEFAHTLANTNADKFGLTHDQAFWKEIKKIRREYMKDVENDPSRWISSYEHSGRSLDEFMCEAFAHAKMRERGIQPRKSYGSDYTYSQRVLDTVDKYFRRSKKK